MAITYRKKNKNTVGTKGPMGIKDRATIKPTKIIFSYEMNEPSDEREWRGELLNILQKNNIKGVFQKKIIRNLRKFFIPFLKDNGKKNYTEWLTSRYPRVSKYKVNEVCQLKTDNKKTKSKKRKKSNKYDIIGSGKLNQFIISGHKEKYKSIKLYKNKWRNPHTYTCNFTLEIKLDKGIFNVA